MCYGGEGMRTWKLWILWLICWVLGVFSSANGVTGSPFYAASLVIVGLIIQEEKYR